MQPLQVQMTEGYNRIVKRIKTFMMLGEFAIFIIRVLSQRIFSVYIGIVLFQFILVTQMSFKTYCVIQSKFYLIMNCILFYLLMINFIQSEINKTDTIQYVLKDKYIVDYVKVGYPVEFFFRLVATIFMWRVYQYSKMKTTQYGDVDSEQFESHTHQNDRIHVRENAHDQDGIWPLGLRHNTSQNQRNLTNSSRNSQYHLPSNGVLSRRVSGRSEHGEGVAVSQLQREVMRRSGVENSSSQRQINQLQQQRQNIIPPSLNRIEQEHPQSQFQPQFTHPQSSQNISHVTFQFQNPAQQRIPTNQQTA